MTTPDSRTTLLRDGVAGRMLEGLVPADRYVDPVARQCAFAAAALRREPQAEAEQDDQLLFGEVFDVILERDGHSLGRARRDGHVGWVETAALHGPVEPPTHRVAAVRAFAFTRPDHKSRAIDLYSMGSLLTIEAFEGRFAKAVGAGWFATDQLAPVGLQLETEPVAVAERFLGAAYLWGGRVSGGLDCSGLILQSLAACGIACPRDTDLQQQALGRPVAAADLRRGDLIFWDGHVAFMADAARVIHANSHHMAVVIEPLADVNARFEALGLGAPLAYRRL